MRNFKGMAENFDRPEKIWDNVSFVAWYLKFVHNDAFVRQKINI